MAEGCNWGGTPSDAGHLSTHHGRQYASPWARTRYFKGSEIFRCPETVCQATPVALEADASSGG